MDALTTLVTLLRPEAVGAKLIHGAGDWSVRYPKSGKPGFALLLKGQCWLKADGFSRMSLEAGDFVLFPAMPAFILSSNLKMLPIGMSLGRADDQAEEVFHGDTTLSPAVTMLGGYFTLEENNAPLLLNLLPRRLHIRADESKAISSIVELVQREAREAHPGRAFVLTRLIDILLVEALRQAPADAQSSGLLAGLRDPQLALALHAIHRCTAQPWTLVALAREAGMSRSLFAERFASVVGDTPLNYLLKWRIAVAKDLLAGGQTTVAEAALAVGYESASGFSTAFSRETGCSPRDFKAV